MDEALHTATASAPATGSGTSLGAAANEARDKAEAASRQAQPAIAAPAIAPLRGRTSLSGRLLLLTLMFAMLAEVLIYLPSAARFRIDYFTARIELANQAALALLAAPDAMLSEELEDELLRGVGARLVAMRRDNTRALMLSDRRELPMLGPPIDLRNWMWWEAMSDAAMTLIGEVDPFVRVVGPSPRSPDALIEVVLPSEPLVRAMRDFSSRIFWVSLAISVFTASLVYLSLQWLLVRPMQRLTHSIVGFRAAPEDARQIIKPSSRSDELGLAERELQMMQQELRQALTQRQRLAQLGIAVSKINHDLRNMLASAQLVSDRLEESDDPTVRQAAPRLVDSLDRAIALCTQILRYGKAEEPAPKPEPVPLHEFCDDVAAALGINHAPGTLWKNRVPEGLVIRADPAQFYRLMSNLMRNAVQAMPQGGEIRVNAAVLENQVAIEIADTGSGLSEAARAHLFEAFRGGARRGGTGLGLAIARELVRGHGGELELARTGPVGTTFRILLPHSEGGED